MFGSEQPGGSETAMPSRDEENTTDETLPDSDIGIGTDRVQVRPALVVLKMAEPASIFQFAGPIAAMRNPRPLGLKLANPAMVGRR